MKVLSGRIAVVTGGGSGIGRQLARRLSREGCSVAICDVAEEEMLETRRQCEAERGEARTRITTHLVDVADELQVLKFRDEVASQHETHCVHLLFNNAGISGGASMVTSSREEWDRTFSICWNGVYFNTRAFLPLMLNADAAHLVNMSSIAGFWAAAGARTPHTAYAAAKFAVKGLTEALIVDFRENAPHIQCSVVMPGHIGTGLMANTRRILQSSDVLDIRGKRRDLQAQGYDVAAMTHEQVEATAEKLESDYARLAPVNAASAAAAIIAGVKADQWRILVGDDAKHLDESVRGDPSQAYDVGFVDAFLKRMKSPGRRLRRAFSRTVWNGRLAALR